MLELMNFLKGHAGRDSGAAPDAAAADGVESVTDVFGNTIGLDGSIGTIFSVRLEGGRHREIFVWREPAHLDFDSAIYLNDGRQTLKWDEIRSLMTKEAVGSDVIAMLRAHEPQTLPGALESRKNA